MESTGHLNSGGKPNAATPPGGEREFEKLRLRMVDRQLRCRDITDPRVLDAMQKVPRHLFVEDQYLDDAYADRALPIAHGQTISQPYIVALMTQLARPAPSSKALDVGGGSGYQAAILAEVCGQVFSIEIVEPLAEQARDRLAGLANVTVRHGNGYRGWPERAPFDLIIAAAAPARIPPPLIDQLAFGGRLVIPVGKAVQRLTVVEKQANGSLDWRTMIPVQFVPMTGSAES